MKREWNFTSSELESLILKACGAEGGEVIFTVYKNSDHWGPIYGQTVECRVIQDTGDWVPYVESGGSATP